MFEIMNENTGHPIKVWQKDMECLEDKCLEQAYHLSQLPFVYKDIDEVMAQQKDMVEIVRKLHTVGVIKG